MDLAEATYQEALGKLLTATTTAERSAVVAWAAERLGRSVATVYRQLAARGWSSGRAPHRDRGASKVAPAEVAVVAGIMATGINARGRANVPMTEARQIAQEQGLLTTDVSDAQMARLLRAQGLDRERLVAPAAAIARVSQHPNHVWFFDISIALQWYFSADGLGLNQTAGAEFYGGKIENFRAIRRVIHRFMAVDHCSGAYYCRYYYSAGESATDVVDFLTHAMTEKSIGRDRFPLRGVPRRLVMDQGSANKSALVTTMLEGLGVTVELHAPRNAKASGAVESRHRHWQAGFESRLAQEPAKDLDSLNRAAEVWCAQANAARPHSRHGRPPIQAWLDITAEQLVEAPPRETMLSMATSKPRTAVLTNQLVLRAEGRQYQVSGPRVYPGLRVTWRLFPMLASGIRVWDDQGNELPVIELVVDKATGFPTNGRRHVWDDATAPGANAPQTPAAAMRAAIVDGAAIAAEAPRSPWAAAREWAEDVALLSPTGRTWAPPTAEALDVSVEPPMGSLEARELAADLLGRPLTMAEAQWWRARADAGLRASEMDAVFAEFQSLNPAEADARPHARAM